MADLNIRNVPEDVLRRIKAQAASEGRTLREWVIERIGAAFPNVDRGVLEKSEVNASLREDGGVEVLDVWAETNDTSPHDAKGCRIYRCGLCAAAGVKDKRRGL